MWLLHSSAAAMTTRSLCVECALGVCRRSRGCAGRSRTIQPSTSLRPSTSSQGMSIAWVPSAIAVAFMKLSYPASAGVSHFVSMVQFGMAQSRRKRKRRMPEATALPPLCGVRGALCADWTLATVEDAAVTRQSLRENWPVKNGETILEAFSSVFSTLDRPRRGLRVAALIISIDRARLARAAKK